MYVNAGMCVVAIVADIFLLPSFLNFKISDEDIKDIEDEITAKEELKKSTNQLSLEPAKEMTWKVLLTDVPSMCSLIAETMAQINLSFWIGGYMSTFMVEEFDIDGN